MSKRSIAWSQGGENSDGSIGAQLTVEVRERLCAVPQLFADVMSTKPIAGRSRKTYEFTRAHRTEFSIQRMCRLIEALKKDEYDSRHPCHFRHGCCYTLPGIA